MDGTYAGVHTVLFGILNCQFERGTSLARTQTRRAKNGSIITIEIQLIPGTLAISLILSDIRKSNEVFESVTVFVIELLCMISW